MRYADEIVQPSRELDLPTDVDLDRAEVRLAKQLIDALSTPFDPTQYRDEYKERLEELIEKKAAGEEVVTQEPSEERRGEVVDLMEALEQSLEEMGGRTRPGSKSGRKRKRKSA